MNENYMIERIESFIELVNESQSLIVRANQTKNEVISEGGPAEVILELNEYIIVTIKEQLSLIDNQLEIIELARLKSNSELFLNNLSLLESNLLYTKKYFKKLQNNQAVTLTC